MYYDTSHYRYIVGTLIANKLNEVEDTILFSDFGFFVNKNNVDAHCDSLNNQAKKFLISKKDDNE